MLLGVTWVVYYNKPNPIYATATEEEEVDSVEGNTMPSTTRLKYSWFKEDKSHDVDDWLTKFESTALANQEEPVAKQWVFQGMLKGEALK